MDTSNNNTSKRKQYSNRRRHGRNWHRAQGQVTTNANAEALCVPQQTPQNQFAVPAAPVAPPPPPPPPRQQQQQQQQQQQKSQALSLPQSQQQQQQHRNRQQRKHYPNKRRRIQEMEVAPNAPRPKTEEWIEQCKNRNALQDSELSSVNGEPASTSDRIQELLREIIQLHQPSTVTLPIISSIDDGNYLDAISKLLEIIHGEEAELEQLRPKNATTPTAERVEAFREMFSSPSNTTQDSPIFSSFTDTAIVPQQMNISQSYSPEPIVVPEPEHENNKLSCIQ